MLFVILLGYLLINNTGFLAAGRILPAPFFWPAATFQAVERSNDVCYNFCEDNHGIVEAAPLDVAKRRGEVMWKTNGQLGS
jgi:hypothetical protein